MEQFYLPSPSAEKKIAEGNFLFKQKRYKFYSKKKSARMCNGCTWNYVFMPKVPQGSKIWDIVERRHSWTDNDGDRHYTIFRQPRL